MYNFTNLVQSYIQDELGHYKVAIISCTEDTQGAFHVKYRVIRNYVPDQKEVDVVLQITDLLGYMWKVQNEN